MILKKVDALIQSETYASIKKDLLDQLERSGTTGRYYTDLVCDYMSFWVDKQLLIEDIQSRGVSIRYNNGGGQSGRKRNGSVSDKIKVNAQMLNILNALGLKPAQNEAEEDDEL